MSLLTPEYPPQGGGVADYVARLVAALAAAGVTVRLFAPAHVAADAPRSLPAGAQLHELPPGFGMATLRRLGRLLAETARADEPLLLQYVPHGFGWKGMNLPLVLRLCASRVRLWTMFHEVNLPLAQARGARQRLMARVQAAMARLLVRRSERLFVSTEAWTPRLRAFGARIPVEPLPIFSNLPVPSSSPSSASLDDGAISAKTVRIVHFGTYGDGITALLRPALVALLEADAQRRALLLGRGACSFAEQLARSHPALIAQLEVLDGADAATLAAALARATVALQPFPDGATTRRTSLMAALALGVATVSSDGALTEALWRDAAAGQPALVLCPADDAAALVAAVNGLLADGPVRAALGARGQAFYTAHFSVERSVATLLGDRPSAAPTGANAAVGSAP